MKVKSLLTTVLLCIASLSYAQKDIIYPEVPFDSLAANNQLARGKSTIKGIAFTKEKSNLGFKPPLASRIYASNVKVILFPVNAYFEAWHTLRKKKAGKKTIVYMSNEAYRFRLETMTDGKGHFTFTEMKPGKYFLQAFMDWTTAHSKNVYTGSGYNNYGGRTDYYTPQSYYVGHSDRIEEYVEVKEDGEIVKVKLH